MKRLILTILCAAFLCACGTEPDGAAVLPMPEAVRETAAPVDWELILKSRTVDLLYPSATERVSLWTLGVREDHAGKLSATDSAMRDYIGALCAAYSVPAVDAAVSDGGSYEEPFVYTAEREGSRPSAEKLLDALQTLDFTLSSQAIRVPMEPVGAAVTQKDLERTHTLLSSYTTSFKGEKLGKKNRVHNITVAASRINGVKVDPGETFSMNRTIGDRTKANGYKLAGAITNGMNTTEYGGGVCQVSTTLFNAVLMADLTIVERYHHSWPMEYAPVGRDATIATGMKDFRFRNDGNEPVYIFATVDETAKTVSVSLYGKKSDAFDHIEIVSEQTGRLPAKAGEVHLDESLPSGTREIERKGRRGRTSVTYLDYYDANGERIKRVTAFEDVYPSIGEIAYVSADLYNGR